MPFPYVLIIISCIALSKYECNRFRISVPHILNIFKLKYIADTKSAADAHRARRTICPLRHTSRIYSAVLLRLTPASSSVDDFFQQQLFSQQPPPLVLPLPQQQQMSTIITRIHIHSEQLLLFPNKHIFHNLLLSEL